jgi:PQQ-dependent catabolism-associated CXXCW motif protein
MRPLILSLALGLMLAASATAAQVEAPAGYRMDAYRAPVPDHVPGGRVVDVTEAHGLHTSGGAVFIDVIGATRHGLGDGAVTWTRPTPRENIPGSVWLPNTGKGALAPASEAWLRRHLDRLTTEHPGTPLLFYCQADCWMSWNAAKRAASWGYGPVLWFPAGTDDWAAAGLPLAPATPAPWP